MNTRKLLSAACIAVFATIYFLSDTIFARPPVPEPFRLVLHSGKSSDARSASLRSILAPDSLQRDQLTPARYIGADPPAPGVSTQTVDPSGTAISLTEGNLTETQSVGEINGSNCSTCPAGGAAPNNTHGIRFNVTYNSRDADGSRAGFDTVMGYGWTHSFNIFLFGQLGSMFRVDGNGRITKYKLNPDNSFTADTGYFETLVRKTRETFVLTQKDQTQFTFASIPGTPFQVGGRVFRLTQIQDRNHDTVTLTYSGGNLVSVRDTYGRAMMLTYNAQNKITSVSDPLARTTTFTYDPTGSTLTAITDPLSKTTQYTYNTLHQLTSKIDRDARAFSYTYTNNKPTGSSDGLGGTHFRLSNPNNWAIDTGAQTSDQLLVYLPSITTKTDGRGNSWRYEYDSRGYVTKLTAPDGATTRYAYDAGTRMVESLTDPNSNTTQYEYDSKGNRTKITLASPFSYVTSFTYEPAFNMMTSMTDSKGRVTGFSYDSRGNRTIETDPLLQMRHWTYDTHGDVLTETDKRGNTTTYSYDAAGDRNMITAPPPLGYLTRLTYDSVGNLTTRTDANGHTTTFDYDGLNRLITETDSAGKSIRNSYDGEGNRIQMIDRNDHSTSYQYDQRQRPIKTTDGLGHVTATDYDGNNNRTSKRDKNGHTTTFEYDVQNRLTRTTDAEGNFNTMTYDPVGNMTSITDANFHLTTYHYDQLNRRQATTDALGYVTLFDYDKGGSGCNTCGVTSGSSLITKQTDGNGKVTYYKYDELDRLTTIVRKEGDITDAIDPSDAVTSHTYDSNNNRLSRGEPNGHITAYEFDVLNRGTRETNAAGDVTRFAYDGVNNVITVIAPNGNVTTNTYDALDRVVEVNDNIGRVASYTYDDVGNRLSQTDGNGNMTRYMYDAVDRPTIVIDPLTRTTVTQYDPVGNVLAVTDREGRRTTNIYDNINRRTSSTDALSHTDQYQYDRMGNVVRITDANGHATQYLHDNINRVTRETYADPAPNTRTFIYDAVNLISRTDQRNQTTVYTYNDLYFLLKRAYPVSPPDNFTYDLSARMLTAERGRWLVTFAYDGANRVTQTTQNSKTVNYVHNIPGRTRTLTFPGGRSIKDEMDSRNRLTITALPTASPIPIVQYRYDLGDRVLTRSYGNNVAANYAYNANDWIKSLDHTVGSGGRGRIAGFGYDFDNEGNKKFEQKRHDAGYSETYQYDPVYRLIDYQVGPLSTLAPTVVTQTTYNLDPVGNWNSKITDAVIQTRVHNEANELIRIDATNLTYDDNGNLQNDGAYAYAYDEENRLIRVTRNSDAAIAGQYQYDALGRRVKKIANPAGVPIETRYFYDGARIIEEQSAAGATQATYTYGNYIDEVLTMDRGGQTYYYHQNNLWSVEAITNGAGVVVERYSYDAYGRASVFTASGVPIPPSAWGTPHSVIFNPWMFTGRQLDEETGLHFYRARYFDPKQGRFITRDPIGNWGDKANAGNAYSYVGNNPQRFTDPSGFVETEGDPDSACTATCVVCAICSLASFVCPECYLLNPEAFLECVGLCAACLLCSDDPKCANGGGGGFNGGGAGGTWLMNSMGGRGSRGGMLSIASSTNTIDNGSFSRGSSNKLRLATKAMDGRTNSGQLAPPTSPRDTHASQNIRYSLSYIDPCGPWGTPESCQIKLRHPGGNMLIQAER